MKIAPLILTTLWCSKEGTRIIISILKMKTLNSKILDYEEHCEVISLKEAQACCLAESPEQLSKNTDLQAQLSSTRTQPESPYS